MKKIIVLLIVIQFGACTSDDQTSTKLEIANLELVVSDIQTTSAKIDVSYTEVDVSEGTIIKKVLYKKENDLEWIETQEIELSNLKRGTTYFAKAVLELDDIQKESVEVKFITKGFTGTNLEGRMGLFNRIYVLHNLDSNADFSQAATFSGFIKIEEDSLAIKNIKISSDKSIEFELPENTQMFFENDDEYHTQKKFSLSLYSGDYHVNLTSDLYLIYNKNPHFTKINFALEQVCLDPFKENWLVQLAGFFWTTKDGNYDIKTDTYNNPKEFTITVSKTGSNLTKVFTFKDMVSIANSCSPTSFDWHRLGRNQGTLFHQNNVIHLLLDKNTYNAGNYTVQLTVLSFDDKEYKSNVFDFKLGN